jgi:hypothetical protein
MMADSRLSKHSPTPRVPSGPQQSARLRYRLCERALTADSALAMPDRAEDPTQGVRDLEAATRAYAAELRDAADIAGRKRLEAERDELTDRLALDVLQAKAVAEVERLKVLQLIARCLGDTSTNAITRLGNEIADKVITPKIRDQFQNEIVRRVNQPRDPGGWRLTAARAVRPASELCTGRPAKENSRASKIW